jgi:hypothetical protein
VTRARKAKWVALLFVSAFTLASATVGVTQGAFAGQTSVGANIITAMPDFRGPTISAFTIGKSAGNATGFIRPSSTYYIYANVTDVGTPPSGTSSVIANVANVTAGQTAVALSGGTWTVGGATYNYRSAQLTSDALTNGSKGISIVATDVAANVTNLSGNVVVDNVVPAPSGLAASGGIAGRPEVGDVLTLSTNDTLDTFSLLASWTGAATTVQLRFVQQGGGDRIQIWNAAGTAQLPFGAINTNRNDFTTGTLSFNGSTMLQSGGTITITLGGPIVGAVSTVGAGANMQWTPVNGVTDRAGNAITTGAYNEPAPNNDLDF